MKRVFAVAISCLAVLSLAGCGSSSKNASTSKDTSTTAAASASASANANVAAASDLLKYCDYSKAAQAFSPASGLNNPNFKDELSNLKTNADAYVKVAPSEIKADVQVYIDDFLKPLITEFERANYDFTKLNTSAFASINSAKVQTALKNIGNYYASHCNK